MITGKTESGFAFSLPKAAIDNMELLDALADASDDDPVAVSRVCRLLLGKELRRQLYDHVRTADGRVPIDALTGELMFTHFGVSGPVALSASSFAAFGTAGKN